MYITYTQPLNSFNYSVTSVLFSDHYGIVRGFLVSYSVWALSSSNLLLLLGMGLRLRRLKIEKQEILPTVLFFSSFFSPQPGSLHVTSKG